MQKVVSKKPRPRVTLLRALNNSHWGCQYEHFGAEWCLTDKTISQILKEEDGGMFENLEVHSNVHLPNLKKRLVKSQAAYPGSYTAFQGWGVDDMTFIYFEIYVE